VARRGERGGRERTKRGAKRHGTLKQGGINQERKKRANVLKRSPGITRGGRLRAFGYLKREHKSIVVKGGLGLVGGGYTRQNEDCDRKSKRETVKNEEKENHHGKEAV